MNCFLKISYLTRHKKYRFWRGGHVNFQQIHRQLLVSIPPEEIAYIINNQAAKGPHTEPFEIKMNEKQFSQYLRKVDFEVNQTLKVRIISEYIKDKNQQNSNLSDSSLNVIIPNLLDRQRSKSEEIHFQATANEAKTDIVEVTQQFLHNSSFDYSHSKRPTSEIGSILKDLQNNSRRSKFLLERKKLTNIPALYLRMKKHSEIREVKD